MVIGQAIRDGLEAEEGGGRRGRAAGEDAAVVVMGVEEGDTEASSGEELREAEHGLDVALRRERKDEHVGLTWLLHLFGDMDPFAQGGLFGEWMRMKMRKERSG